jgi:hypothetical protein
MWWESRIAPPSVVDARGTVVDSKINKVDYSPFLRTNIVREGTFSEKV